MSTSPITTTTAPRVSLNEDQVQDMVRATATAYAMYRRQAAGKMTDSLAPWLDIACRSMKLVAIMARVELEQLSELLSETFSSLQVQGDFFGAELACEYAMYGLLAEIHG